jgi:hypothetical protein
VHWLLLLAALAERAGPDVETPLPPPAAVVVVAAAAAVPPMLVVPPPYCVIISVTCSSANSTQRLAS